MDWLNYQPVCTQCSSYEGSFVLIATTTVSSSVNRMLHISWVKKTWMLNLNGREEIKFLGFLQFTEGRYWQSQQKKGLSRSPWKSKRDEYVLNHAAHKTLSLHLLERYVISSFPLVIWEQRNSSVTHRAQTKWSFSTVLTTAKQPLK